MSDCCPQGKRNDASYETVKILKSDNACKNCEDYSKAQKGKPVAVVSCEGACFRGEVSRQAANELCYNIAPDKTVRICLGSAFTKDSGQRDLVKNTEKVLVLEGCFVQCASRMLGGVIENFKPEIVLVDRLYKFDTSLFGVNEMKPVEILNHAKTVAEKISINI